MLIFKMLVKNITVDYITLVLFFAASYNKKSKHVAVKLKIEYVIYMQHVFKF